MRVFAFVALLAISSTAAVAEEIPGTTIGYRQLERRRLFIG